jgi:cytochrome c oxidase subunit IV
MHTNPGQLETGTIADGSKASLKTRALHEVRRFAVMFLYLWLILGLYVLSEKVALAQRGTLVTAQGFALVNALILAKVMLIVEDLNLLRWIRPRPLIYPIVCESLLLSLLFICFHVLEKVIGGLLAGRSVAESVPAIGGGGIVGLVSVAVMLFVALIPFFAFKHVARELGQGRLNAMLFGTPIREAGR